MFDNLQGPWCQPIATESCELYTEGETYEKTSTYGQTTMDEQTSIPEQILNHVRSFSMKKMPIKLLENG